MRRTLATPSSTVIADLLDHLGSRLLLILDNREHLIEAAATCAAEILAEAPRGRILTTSREPPRIIGERVYRLTPLYAAPLKQRRRDLDGNPRDVQPGGELL